MTLKKNKFYITLGIIVGIFFNALFAYALTNSEKGAILNNFTQRQYDLIFQSDLVKFTNEYSDVFSISSKVDTLSAMYSEAETDRKYVQTRNNALLETIGSLEESIELLDSDILATTEKVNKINSEVIRVKAEIDANTRTMNELKQKIEENTEILLEYLVYIYKKSNTAYDGSEIDNIKSILLNGESISDLLNDLYFKGIIQVTGKNLIDNHRKYISELYLKKVVLEKQEQDLKTLRKQGIIEQKILEDKQKFKKEILESSKGQQEYYGEYLAQKLRMENELKLQTIKEQMRLASTRKQILDKYGCEYVDVSKNTVEARVLQVRNPKCYSINKIIISETQLVQGEAEIPLSNPLSWPVNPIQGITAFYRDQEYEQIFGAQHNAVDIKVPQGTEIEAPMDGYVIYLKMPTSQDYSYLAIKHYDGYITVYGHLSEIIVEEHQFVQKGEVIGKTGGEFGTYGAGYVTTGPHLHFEVFKNQEYIDPLTVLDLAYIKYQDLPEKYEFKFALDFKNQNGYDYQDLNSNSKIFTLKGDTEIDRQKYLLSNYAAAGFANWQMWIDESLNGNVDPSFVMCIGLAESGLGKSLTTAYNIGNVGNNDRGDRVGYTSARQGISAIVYTLNNKYFQKYNTLAPMSGGGRLEAGLPGCGETAVEYCYATDTQHWNNNVKRCLSHLKGYYILDNYNFRF